MREEEVFFPAGPISLQGLYAEAGGSRGAVVSHPHPQMGGSMWNNVVETLILALYESGFSTLRFNFRGAGRSGGTYDNGRGERDDVAGALDFLREKAKKDLLLAGYSFGAWVNARAIGRGAAFGDAVFVSPPLDMMKFDSAALAGKVGLVICGDGDQFCSQSSLRRWASEVECCLRIVPRTDHFYAGKEQEITDIIKAFFSE